MGEKNEFPKNRRTNFERPQNRKAVDFGWAA
jgi:hypothetical protein